MIRDSFCPSFPWPWLIWPRLAPGFPVPPNGKRRPPTQLPPPLPIEALPTRVMGPSGDLPCEGDSDPDVPLGCGLHA